MSWASRVRAGFTHKVRTVRDTRRVMPSYPRKRVPSWGGGTRAPWIPAFETVDFRGSDIAVSVPAKRVPQNPWRARPPHLVLEISGELVARASRPRRFGTAAAFLGDRGGAPARKSTLSFAGMTSVGWLDFVCKGVTASAVDTPATATPARRGRAAWCGGCRNFAGSRWDACPRRSGN